jgi:hypothetical protein
MRHQLEARVAHESAKLAFANPDVATANAPPFTSKPNIQFHGTLFASWHIFGARSGATAICRLHKFLQPRLRRPPPPWNIGR